MYSLRVKFVRQGNLNVILALFLQVSTSTICFVAEKTVFFCWKVQGSMKKIVIC